MMRHKQVVGCILTVYLVAPEALPTPIQQKVTSSLGLMTLSLFLH